MEDKPDSECVITSEISIPAPLTEVWHAWTAKEGAECKLCDQIWIADGFVVALWFA